jgi:hypothetical protein
MSRHDPPQRVVTERTGDVAFLDARDRDLADVLPALTALADGLSASAVITVHTDCEATAEELVRWAADPGGPAEPIVSFRQPPGFVVTLRRR